MLCHLVALNTDDLQGIIKETHKPAIIHIVDNNTFVLVELQHEVLQRFKDPDCVNVAVLCKLFQDWCRFDPQVINTKRRQTVWKF